MGIGEPREPGTILPFPGADERQAMRSEKNDELAEAALKEGVSAETPHRVFQAIAERAKELTQGRPFRFSMGRKVRVPRSSGAVDEDWEILTNNPTVGWAQVIKRGPNDSLEGSLEKKLSWPELYEHNPDFQAGDTVSVKRSSGEVENGWTVARVGFKEGAAGEKIPMVYVEKAEGQDTLEKALTLAEIKEINP